MRKYLTLAAVVGALAFLSVPAQAQPAASATAPAAAPATPAAPAVGSAMQAAAPAASSYAKDHAECEALASAPSTEGAAPSDADKAAALKKCLVAKGHSLDEITKEDAPKGAAPAPAAVPATPAAPAAPAAH